MLGITVSSKGVAANCASALAQMAAASCVQEEKEEKESQEPSDTIAQGNCERAVYESIDSEHTPHIFCTLERLYVA